MKKLIKKFKRYVENKALLEAERERPDTECIHVFVSLDIEDRAIVTLVLISKYYYNIEEDCVAKIIYEIL